MARGGRRELLTGMCTLAAACGLQPASIVPAPSSARDEPSPERVPHPAGPPPADPALGPVDDLDSIERRAFVDPDAFQPPPSPRPGSWRSRVEEPTETFADFVVSNPNPLHRARPRLALLPWGTFPHEVVAEQEYVAIVRSPDLQWLADFAGRFFGVPCSVLAARPWDPGELPLRIRSGHDQFDARAILTAAAASLPADAHAMTVLVNRDIYYDDAQEFAFGYGMHRDRLAVMSFARFDPQFAGHAREPHWIAKIKERSLKVLAHEMAHTFGLRHCTFYACLLGGFAHLDELDDAPLRLCPVCLRKLHHVAGFDLVARYEGLRTFYADAELPEAARWVERRIRRMQAPT